MRHSFALLILLAIAALPAHASGLHRCIGVDGGSIFTDQECADIGANTRPALVSASASEATTTSLSRARACAHSPDELVRGLRGAIAAGNVNQVAAFYHWPGVTSAGSEEILKHLLAITRRPLISVELLGQHAPHTAADSRSLASAEPPPEANAVELVQSRSATDATPMRSALALTQYMGCWWVHF